MDPAAGQAQTTSASRDTMFCHECHDEWYRDEHGLTCPECGSDFTEIVEDNNDPRNHHENEDEDHGSMPSFEETPQPQHPLHDHNPWATQQNNGADDPEEGDISNMEWRQVGPGRFAVRTTIHRSIPIGNNGNPAAAMGGFASFLNNIIGQAARGPDENREHQNASPFQNQQGATRGEGTMPGGHRFTYTAGARLFPRDANQPGPQVTPVDEMTNVLAGLMAAFGNPNGQPGSNPFQQQFPGGAGFGGPPGHDHDHEHEHAHNHQHPLNPILGLFAQMMPGNGQAGDFVYSQEGLDRIISQLMDQNASSNAPGPASQQDIDALTRKQVTKDMFGSDGKAECSICMDDVNIGEEVTELPCRHWFHHPCVSAWLSEHDTCPHCRKGISKTNTDQNGSPNTGGPSSSGPAPNPHDDPASNMPGAFTTATSSENSAQNASHFGSQLPPGRSNPTTDDAGGGGGGGGGIGDRLRRSLFGPQR